MHRLQPGNITKATKVLVASDHTPLVAKPPKRDPMEFPSSLKRPWSGYWSIWFFTHR
jgi:hypothetical protein